MQLSLTRRIWQRWQAAAGRWRGWSVCPALLAPETEDITARKSPRPAADGLLGQLKRTLEPAVGADPGRIPLRGGTALVLDLEPILGVHIAARLNELRLANAVLLLPRWPYQQALLPVDGLLHGLVTQARRLSDGDLPNVVFVLDAERTRPVPHRTAHDQRADNRYRLMPADLPNLAALRARGIARVVKVCADERGSLPSPRSTHGSPG